METPLHALPCDQHSLLMVAESEYISLLCRCECSIFAMMCKLINFFFTIVFKLSAFLCMYKNTTIEASRSIAGE